MKYQDRYDSLLQYYWDESWHDDPPPTDWRLAKCQMIQESGGNSVARSTVGAVGLFQLMPGTAQQMMVPNRLDPEQSIRGGIGYFHRMWRVFSREQGFERVKLGLGSYNAGLGEILKAQTLAEERGLDRTRWVSIVQVLPNITGPENARQTETYVANIIQCYNALAGTSA